MLELVSSPIQLQSPLSPLIHLRILLIRELSNSIGELSYSIRELSYGIEELSLLIGELSNPIKELCNWIAELSYCTHIKSSVI